MIRTFIVVIILSTHVLNAYADTIYKCVVKEHVIYTDQPCNSSSVPIIKTEEKAANSVRLEVDLTPVESSPYSADDVGVAISSIKQIRIKMNRHLHAIRKAKSEEIGMHELKILIEKLKRTYPDSSKERRRKLMVKYRAYLSTLNNYMKSGKIRKITDQYVFTLRKWKLQLNFLRGTNAQPFYNFMEIPPYEKIGKSGRMIFGGKNGDVYLGCIDCELDDIDNILNKNGDFGSCQTPKRKSLYCHDVTDEYGTKLHTSGLSACDSQSTHPPSIFDHYGKYYGRFSLSGDFGRIDAVCDTTSGLFKKYRDRELCNIVKVICENT